MEPPESSQNDLTPEEESGVCLNCGSELVRNYCAVCGQKSHPTRIPFHRYRSDFMEAFFNLDNRFLRTLKGLFVSPGAMTREYIEGKRAVYVAPVRLYLTLSVVYFLITELADTGQVFLVNFTEDDQLPVDVVSLVQYSMFLLVPAFAGILNLFHRKQRAFFIEHLIIALHIHCIWFILLIIEPFTIKVMEWSDSQFLEISVRILRSLAQISILGYLGIYLRRMYDNGWVSTVVKSFGVLLSYVLILAAVIIIVSILST